ncbi:uncharacterized protein LOC125490016 [Plutella xylostella]|uniref:uncharacterized protein LOC125490016 n=1 Tax=Plutella xylostella TaxID=51655 RepID=UPI002032F36D|nr:uncharacterized protein LOC125490016 [Plutella xylostella]
MESKKDKEEIVILENKLEDMQKSQRKTSIEIKNVPLKGEETKKDLLEMIVKLSENINLKLVKPEVKDIIKIKKKENTKTDVLDCETDEQRAIRIRTDRAEEQLRATPCEHLPFTRHELTEVLQGISPKKAPGEDGLTADICRAAIGANVNIFLALINTCLRLGYFPKYWKAAVVKILRKPCKEDYSQPKSHRPIGLLAVLGKILEKMFAKRLLWQLGSEDGSKIEGKVGGAVTLWRNGNECKTNAFRLENYNSVFQAELVAISRALNLIAREPHAKRGNILSDSRSALELLRDPSSTHPLAYEIRKKIEDLKGGGGDVAFYWVKAHIGIPGNERADELAKRAALTRKDSAAYSSFPLSHAIRWETTKQWQERYATSSTGRVTFLFFPNVTSAYKILGSFTMCNTKAQLWTGHGGFRAYLHRFKLSESPSCSCDDETPETIEHLLEECPRFGAARFDCEQKVKGRIRSEEFPALMANESTRSVFMGFALNVVKLANGANRTR